MNTKQQSLLRRSCPWGVVRTCYVFVNGRRIGPVLLRPLGRFARLLDGQVVRVEFASRAVSAANEVR